MERTDVDLFEKLMAQLEGFHQELTVLVKKSTSDGVNLFKLKYINDVIRQFNSLLGEKYRPFHDFEEFSADAVPSNSDVSFILSQYLECAEKFRADHIHNPYSHEWYWKLDDGKGPRTSAPKKIFGK